ncbi:MAG: endonuclease III [Clostridiales bacterium]|nr:endonuclease III [Clostridiales bacterium]
MDTKTRAGEIVAGLKKEYPIPECTLDYTNAWQLLFNARLAAQCTDKRVNEVAVGLYRRFPTLEDFASADIAELEELIRPTGFFRVKSADLKNAAIMLLSEFGGKVPDNLDDLLKLPGVGRKVANLILGDVYNAPGAVVADTHCIRLSNRLGLCETKDPKKVEFALRELIDPAETNNFCHRLVLHGRAVCQARLPQCEKCCVAHLCKTAGMK